MLLHGKTILITGGGGGIGEGVARVCHRDGANVVIGDIRADAAAHVAESLGARALAVACDVRDRGQLADFVGQAVGQFGRIDGLVNNAGINCIEPTLGLSEETWDNVLSINLRSAFVLTRMVCRQMLEQHPAGGSVVNIASVHTHGALPESVTYDAAKWGMIGFTKSLAIEFAARGIRVNAVSPGLVATQIWEDVQMAAPSRAECQKWLYSNIPIGRPIEPTEIGEAVAFLLSDRSRCIVGANLFVDGGMSSQLLSKPPFEFKPIGDE
jgi:NAD(P)-dependent dehydrogenase (short-subunit alcohol dehydrogenase family)